MDYALIVILQLVVTIANLALISAGLAVIFGMMRIINMAHGEFLMLGGYAALVSHQAGLNLWLAIFVAAPVTVGLIGAVLERLVIRRLYGRMIDTMLATWGVSLALVGVVTVIFGNRVSGISPPLGSVPIGGYAIGLYELLTAGVTALLFLGGWIVLRRTPVGLIARGAMQNREMAAALGVDPARVYATTFVTGAAISGLAGALIAPITGVAPSIGSVYIAKAFITVISGGTAILTGALSASALLGSVNTAFSFVMTPVLGEVALLAAAVLLLRVLPRGITGRFFRRSL
ncbi:branched-chain amino acid transport system permease protein [Methylopila capsulata]|uniref:Branched-chain amino acid ABC transporter permease n=1 Tax=Methylopila capsulata TaxID=61654 RepID=A0A9W6MRW3_9HYPH|nr:branched-chain amino acid ABC transporter permease [Methylopila capsulata]MBM7850369.1 branched-chain amino acid transport system permease protein [Methylopila capsulata]GLK55662.1 branched-chain amino acid ABC transporter permease [Methylopila capsulata]